MITLLLESDPEDRSSLTEALMGALDTLVYPAESCEQAESTAAVVTPIDLFVAHVHPGQEDSVAALRASMRLSQPGIVSVLLTGHDITPWFPSLDDRDALFLKPIDFQEVFAWISDFFPSASREPAPFNTGATEEEGAPSTSIPGSGEAPAEPESYTRVVDPVTSPIAPLPPGTTLGDYELLQFISRGGASDRFIALQRSIDRKVRLRMLRPDYQVIPAAREQFRAEAKAQAAIRHPQIATVFEAHETNNALYYTQELIAEDSLDRIVAQNRTLREEELLGLMKSAASVYQYLEKNGQGCQTIYQEHIHWMPDGSVKVANTVALDENRASERDQLLNLAKCVHPLMDAETISNGTLPNLLYKMSGTSDEEQESPITTWDALLEEIEYIESQWQEMTGGTMSARRAGLYAGIVSGSAALLILLTVLGVWFFQVLTRSRAKVADDLIWIPAGKFIYQLDQEAELPEFWISAHEVTVGQYSEFLKFLEAHPDSARSFDHPEQPSYKKDHQPLGWSSYSKAARENKAWRFQDGEIAYSIGVNLDCPITMVDWWDAYAYAKWKGRRLPTEQEWEKAARGRQGNIFPWGSKLDLTKLNSGVDYIPPPNPAAPPAEGAPAELPEVDGHRFWSPVDAVEGDASHYLVRGMAGNVSEWTGDWVPHPSVAGKVVPVTRGASFMTKKEEEMRLTTRILSADAADRHLWVGFRTASSSRPGQVNPSPAAVPPPAPAPASIPKEGTPPAPAARN